jgi:hypothetical protein
MVSTTTTYLMDVSRKGPRVGLAAKLSEQRQTANASSLGVEWRTSGAADPASDSPLLGW